MEAGGRSSSSKGSYTRALSVSQLTSLQSAYARRPGEAAPRQPSARAPSLGDQHQHGNCNRQESGYAEPGAPRDSGCVPGARGAPQHHRGAHGRLQQDLGQDGQDKQLSTEGLFTVFTKQTGQQGGGLRNACCRSR